MTSSLFTPADDFAEFYAAYPRKVGKGQARKAYAKALKITSHDEIMFGLSQQRPSMEAKEKQFIAHPATWLNGERWDDEIEQPDFAKGPGPNSGRNDRFDEARQRALRSAESVRELGTDCF